jgi:hypothetical protein
MLCCGNVRKYCVNVVLCCVVLCSVLLLSFIRYSIQSIIYVMFPMLYIRVCSIFVFDLRLISICLLRCLCVCALFNTVIHYSPRFPYVPLRLLVCCLAVFGIYFVLLLYCVCVYCCVVLYLCLSVRYLKCCVLCLNNFRTYLLCCLCVY